MDGILANLWKNRPLPGVALSDLEKSFTSQPPLKKQKSQAESESSINSKSLCELLISQAFVGPTPSALLLSYLRYALSVEFILPNDFFEVVVEGNTKPDPSRPLQFEAHLDLIGSLLPFMKSHDNLLHDSVVLRISILLQQGVIHCINSIQSAIQPESNITVNPGTYAFINNLQTCMKLLRKVYKSYMKDTTLILSKLSYGEMWREIKDLLAQMKSKYVVYLPSQVSLISMQAGQKLQDIWIELKDIIILITSAIDITKTQSPIIAPDKLLDLSLDSSYHKPWFSLQFVIEQELSGKCIRTLEETAEHLYLLCNMKDHTIRHLLMEMWCITLRSLQNFDPISDEWKLLRNFLLTKIPLLIDIWKEKGILSNDQQPNDVELSLADLLNFPSLIPMTATSPTEPPKSILDDLLSICVTRNLISRESIQSLIPDKVIPDSSASPFNIDSFLTGDLPHAEQDILVLDNFFTNCASAGLEKLEAFALRLCETIGSECPSQSALVNLLIEIIQPKNQFPNNLIAKIFNAILAKPSLLNMISMCNVASRFVRITAYYLDTWGQTTSSLDSEIHNCFDSAFLLLIYIFDRYEVKFTSKESVVRFWLTADEMELPQLSQLFVKWYQGVVHSLIVPNLPEESFGTQPNAQVPLALETLFSEQLPSASDESIDSNSFNDRLGDTTAWQMVVGIPPFMEQLTQGLIEERISAPMVINNLAYLFRKVPYTSYCVLNWLSRDLESGVDILDSSGIPISARILLSLLDLTYSETVLELTANKITTTIHKYFPNGEEIILQKLRYTPKSVNSFQFGLNSGVSDLIEMLESYHTTLLNGNQIPPTLHESTLSQFKWILHCIGRAKFCSTIVAEVMKSISSNSIGISSVNSLSIAEMSGCLLGASGGLQIMIDLYRTVLPDILPHTVHYNQGQILATLCLYTGLAAGFYSSLPKFREKYEVYEESRKQVERLLNSIIDHLTHASSTSGGLLGFTHTILCSLPSELDVKHLNISIPTVRNKMDAAIYFRTINEVL